MLGAESGAREKKTSSFPERRHNADEVGGVGVCS